MTEQPQVPSTITVSSDALSRSEQWMREREALLASAPRIVAITCQDDLDQCARLKNAIRTHIKTLETERKRVTAPLDDMKKEIMVQEKVLRAQLETEMNRLSKLSNSYATRLAADAEEVRRHQAAELERQRMAAAEAEAQTRELFGDEATLEPAPVAPPPPPPPPEKPKAAGGRVVKRWTFTVTDPRALPREYLTVNESAIRAHIQFAKKTGADPEIPGVRFQKHMSVE